MIIIQIIALLVLVAVILGFLHLKAELQSINGWIGHVNDKLTRIEYSIPSTKKTAPQEARSLAAHV